MRRAGTPRDTPGPAADGRALARRLAALEEGAIRSRAAGSALAELAPERGARVVAELVERAHESAEARVAVAAIASALAAPRGIPPHAWRADAYAAATELGLAEVSSLLVAPPPQRRYAEPRDGADARLAHLTLGHKKAMARAQRDPDLLARLAAEGDPGVVRELLRNPQLTEPFVVRFASRRPCRPGTLRCIFESPRWRTRPAVALALVRNPYVETELALKLLPGLAAPDLREIARDGVLHPLVRAIAGRLASRGPRAA